MTDIEYIQLYRPYMTKEVVASFLQELNQKLDNPDYTLTLSDLWLIETLDAAVGFDRDDLQDKVRSIAGPALFRPHEVDREVDKAYKMLDADDIDHDSLDQLLENLEQWDTEVAQLQSMNFFMRPTDK